MLPDGIWQSTAIASQGGSKFNFGYMPIPGSDNAKDNNAYYGKYDLMWQVHSKSKVKKEALAWLDFISKKENYQYFINIVGWLPTQPDIQITDKVLMEASKIPMKLSFEQIHVSRESQGQFADGSITWVVPLGTIKTVEEYANLAQKDWDAAAVK
jgi:raffinose/stachyose/melibiose transport system substrate-binding protein